MTTAGVFIHVHNAEDGSPLMIRNDAIEAVYEKEVAGHMTTVISLSTRWYFVTETYRQVRDAMFTGQVFT